MFGKLAGLFVEMPDSKEENPSTKELEDLLADTESLLSESLTPAEKPPEPVEEAPKAKPKSPLDWSVAEVFKAGGVEEGKNSAQTLLTLVEKLEAFEPAQRLAMVRAMDAADPSWDEDTGKADAHKRLQVLQRFIDHLEIDASKRISETEKVYALEKQSNDDQISELEAQIADLQKRVGDLQDANLLAQKTSEQMVAEHREALTTRVDEVKALETKYRDLLDFFKS